MSETIRGEHTNLTELQGSSKARRFKKALTLTGPNPADGFEPKTTE